MNKFEKKTPELAKIFKKWGLNASIIAQAMHPELDAKAAMNKFSYKFQGAGELSFEDIAALANVLKQMSDEITEVISYTLVVERRRNWILANLDYLSGLTEEEAKEEIRKNSENI